MITSDLMNIFLIVGFIVITFCIVAITYFVIQALRAFTKLAEDINDTTQNIKNKLKFKALAALPAVLIGLVANAIKKRRG